MPFRRADAKYSTNGPKDEFGGEVALLRILTAHGKIQLYLDDSDYRAIRHAVEDAGSDGLIDSTYTEYGEFKIESLPPSHDDDVSLVVEASGFRTEVSVAMDELERVGRVMDHAHPDLDDHPDVIEGVA